MSGKTKLDAAAKKKIAAKEECVQVVIRCRPLSSTEKRDKRKKIVHVDSKECTITLQDKSGGGGATGPRGASSSDAGKSFRFDAVFGENSTQAEVYEETTRLIVDSCLSGYNGTVFAYGQTGTGKTFTMEGEFNFSDDSADNELRGIIPRAFEQVFTSIEVSQDVQYLIRASFIEIYNELVYDLLAPNRPKLELREHPETGVFVENVTNQVVQSVQETYQKLLKGKKVKRVGETKMNPGSSRSHCIFTLTIESQKKGPDGRDHITKGLLNMVDLAGCERLQKTGATGIRAKEGAKINLSLSMLGLVISALTNPHTRHIPYRDSALTRLLQNSLGGNSKTVMIANIGPADWNHDETLSTLRFADRTKHIKNKPKINEDPKDALLRVYQEELAALKKALETGDFTNVPAKFLNGEEGGGARPKKVVKRVVEKIVTRGVDKAKLQALQEQAHRTKLEMEQQAERERLELQQRTQTIQQEAEKVKQELTQRERKIQDADDARKRLEQNLKHIEHKLLKGARIIDAAKKRELEMARKEAELKARRLEQARKEKELRQREDHALKLKAKYQSKEEEVADITRKLQKVRRKVKSQQDALDRQSAEYQKEREDLLDTARELRRFIALKRLILSHFVSEDEHQRVKSRAEWDPEQEEWKLRKLDYTLKKLSLHRPGSARDARMRPMTDFAHYRASSGDQNPRFKLDNIVELELDMPQGTTRSYAEMKWQEQQQHQQQQQQQQPPPPTQPGGMYSSNLDPRSSYFQGR